MKAKNNWWRWKSDLDGAIIYPWSLKGAAAAMETKVNRYMVDQADVLSRTVLTKVTLICDSDLGFYSKLIR